MGNTGLDVFLRMATETEVVASFGKQFIVFRRVGIVTEGTIPLLKWRMLKNTTAL